MYLLDYVSSVVKSRFDINSPSPSKPSFLITNPNIKLLLFIIQVLLNVSWNYIFFNQQQVLFALLSLTVHLKVFPIILIFRRLTGLYSANPTLYLALKIFLTEYSKRGLVTFPFLYADTIAFIPFGISFEISSKSWPAKKAVKSIFLTLEYSETPFMFRASVIIKPLKFNESFRSP